MAASSPNSFRSLFVQNRHQSSNNSHSCSLPETLSQDNNAPAESIPEKKSPSVIFVGSTGAGKSTLGNFLHDLGEGPAVFDRAPTGDHRPKTQETTAVGVDIGNSFGFNGSKLMLIDTPGLNESIEKDLDHITSLYSTISSIGEINVLVLVVPYNFKLDAQWSKTMSFFRDAFLPLFTLGHVCLILTHMSEEDYENAQDDVGFEAVKTKILRECNEVLGCEITAIFCLNAFLAKPTLSKAKSILEHPEKLKDNWISRCLQTRENIFGYISAMQPVLFKLPAFPLPPLFDELRLRAISQLEARDDALMKTLKATNSALDRHAGQLSRLNLAVEDVKHKLEKVISEIVDKNRTRQTRSVFKSGDRTFTGGKFASQVISLQSPSPENVLAFILYNCSISPQPTPETNVGAEISVTVVPNWLAFTTVEAMDKKRNWFAKIWLEYDGAEFYKQDLEDLQNLNRTLVAELRKTHQERKDLNAQMQEASKESHEISATLNDIHLLRDFLKKATFPLTDFTKLRKAFPLDDFSVLKSCVLSGTVECAAKPMACAPSTPIVTKEQPTTSACREPVLKPQDVPVSPNNTDNECSNTHEFSPARFNKPTWCDFCKRFIKNPFGKQGFSCSKCDIRIHYKCLELAQATPCNPETQNSL